MLELLGVGKTKGSYPLEEGVAKVIGRGKDCSIRIKEPKLSRNHCVVKCMDGIIYVEDLGSKNGTKLNGKKIEGNIEIKEGDQLSLSENTSFKLHDPEVSEYAVPVEPKSGTEDISEFVEPIPEPVSQPESQPEEKAKSSLSNKKNKTAMIALVILNIVLAIIYISVKK